MKNNATYLKDYTVADYCIAEVALNFVLDAQQTQVVAKLSVQKNPQSPSQNPPLILQGEDLELMSLSIDGLTLDKSQYQQSHTDLKIKHVPQNRAFLLVIKNNIHPISNTGLEGLYLSNTMLCTQCEAQGFRKITYFLDRPDVMARFTTTLVGDKDKYPVLLSNGNKVAIGELANNRHWVTWEDPFKKPCYLFALVAGHLLCIKDTWTTMSGREICLQIFVEAHDIDKCRHAMRSLKNAMRWDEEVYGREYDLDLYMIVAVSHFNSGAMENKGLNIFNTQYVLARPDTATDSDYEKIEGVIAHEYFHNWTGNRITCRDWFQLSLKEGLTVFRDQQFTADQTSSAVKRITDVQLLRTRQFAEDAGPLSHPIRPHSYMEIRNFYTLTVYEKGAEIVRMIHTLVGDKGFRKGSDLYFQRHDGQAVTCDDFVRAMQDANDFDLGLFSKWYSQAGTPILEITQSYNQAQKTLTLTIQHSHQSTVKGVLHIPIKCGLLYVDGSCAPICINSKKAVNEVIIGLKERQQTVVFEQLKEQPIVSLLRGFSAPIILKMTQSLDELTLLLKHDTDTFNRWDAGQKMSCQIILGLVADYQQGIAMQMNPKLMLAYQHILRQSWHDLSYFALLLNLPTENYLAEQMKVVDVDAIHHAREFVKQTLAQQLQSQFQSLYKQHHQDEPEQLSADAMGRRQIKNICLDYLTQLTTQSSHQLTEKQFNNAKNMTDQMAALTCIVNSDNPSKPTYLRRFFQQWQHEALVIDKWFAVQASSRAKGTFGVVQSLLNHPAFTLSNPNRVRSLIAAFSQNNPFHFHATNGEGYQFLTEQIIAIDPINPQIAARMVSALTLWKRHNNHRQALMKTALQRLLTMPKISKDVFEVVSKSLVE